MGPEILSSTGAGVWRKAPIEISDNVPSKNSLRALPVRTLLSVLVHRPRDVHPITGAAMPAEILVVKKNI